MELLAQNTALFDELFQGIYGLADVGILAMFLVGFILMFLAVRYDYEPVLLFPMGIGCVLANIPGHYAVLQDPGSEGFLYVLYKAGIANELFPVMIFIAIGAMCEFSPLMRKPFSWLLCSASPSTRRLLSASSARQTARPRSSLLPATRRKCLDRCP